MNTDELWNELRTLGLLSPGQIERGLSLQREHDGPQRCAAWLVEAGLLTRFQVEQVLAGKGRRLRVGPYILRERLGAGGMGRVYQAEHRRMRRVVALKLTGRVRRDAAALGRFNREVEAAGRLHHPHIVTAYDAGQSRGRLYLAMEYVEGIDLERLVGKTGPLPIELACEIVQQTAEALQHAHERGLLHRDVKPSNLMLAPPGVTVKLLDLGLALWTDRQLSSPSLPEAPDEELCGTPDFMAPECGRDRQQLDGRGDLYSLGCTFYFLLAGQVPYPGGGWTEKLLRHHLGEPTPLRQLRPDVPAEIVGIVERLMARERDERYPTAASVAAAVKAITTPGTNREPAAIPETPNLPSRQRGLRRFGVTACLVVLFGVTAAASVRWLQSLHTSVPTPRGELVGAAIRIEGVRGEFLALAQAISAAPSGAVIVVHGRGPVVSPPLRWHSKSLTIRAEGPERPRLELRPGDSPWQALFETDQMLTLEGLDLAITARPRGERRPTAAPLISCEAAPLYLSDCRLTGGSEGAVIVARNASEVRIRNCRIDGGTVGLSLEVGQGTACRVRIAESRLSLRGPQAAALSLWSAEVRQTVPLTLELEGNTIDAGRVAALRALPARLTITAHSNRFRYRTALLTFAGYAERDPWRSGLVWQGADNSYDGPASWLWVENEPVALQQLSLR